MTTYAFGDIHGCLEPLQALVRRCLQEVAGSSATFVFLGDYIDRGPDSKGVVEFLMDLQQRESRLHVVCLAGNHEIMAVAVAKGLLRKTNWMSFGGAATLHSYGVGQASKIPASHLAWMTSLPLRFDDGLRLFVHAGIFPGRRIDQQDAEDLIGIREPFLSSTIDHGRFIVHGHTPTHNRLPELKGNRLNLDTGAVFGGPLTAAVFTGSRAEPSRFLSEPSRVVSAIDTDI